MKNVDADYFYSDGTGAIAYICVLYIHLELRTIYDTNLCYAVATLKINFKQKFDRFTNKSEQ